MSIEIISLGACILACAFYYAKDFKTGAAYLLFFGGVLAWHFFA